MAQNVTPVICFSINFILLFFTFTFALLSAHVVRSSQHARRNCQSNLLRRFQINHELEFSWLFHGEEQRAWHLSKFCPQMLRRGETTHPHLRHAARPWPAPFAMCCAPKFIHGRAVEALSWMKLELIFREVLSRNRTFQSLEWWD